MHLYIRVRYFCNACVNCEYQVVDAVRDFIVAGDRNNTSTTHLASEDGKNRDRLPRRNSRSKTILHTAPDVLAWIEN